MIWGEAAEGRAELPFPSILSNINDNINNIIISLTFFTHCFWKKYFELNIYTLFMGETSILLGLLCKRCKKMRDLHFPSREISKSILASEGISGRKKKNGLLKLEINQFSHFQYQRSDGGLNALRMQQVFGKEFLYCRSEIQEWVW